MKLRMMVMYIIHIHRHLLIEKISMTNIPTRGIAAVRTIIEKNRLNLLQVPVEEARAVAEAEKINVES